MPPCSRRRASARSFWTFSGPVLPARGLFSLLKRLSVADSSEFGEWPRARKFADWAHQITEPSQASSPAPLATHTSWAARRSMVSISFAMPRSRRVNATKSLGGQPGSDTVVAIRSRIATNRSRRLPVRAAWATDIVLLGDDSPGFTARRFADIGCLPRWPWRARREIALIPQVGGHDHRCRGPVREGRRGSARVRHGLDEPGPIHATGEGAHRGCGPFGPLHDR